MYSLVADALTVSIGGTVILHGVSVVVKRREVVYLMGPNGSGKSTLIYAIVGWEDYRVESGRVIVDGEDVTGEPPEARARLGVAAAFQNPPELEGVRVGSLLTRIVERHWRVSRLDALKLVQRFIRMVGLPGGILEREFHVGLSGGERKKLELVKVLAMKPKYALLDEPDSGVDVDSLPRIGEAIRFLVEELGAGILVVTHTTRLCKVVRPEKTYVMMKGSIVASGGPELARSIEERGYSSLLNDMR